MVGDRGYTIALDEDGEELCALFQKVLMDRKYKSTIRTLRKEQARVFMQELQEVRFHLKQAIDAARRRNCRHSTEVLHGCKKTNSSVPLSEYL